MQEERTYRDGACFKPDIDRLIDNKKVTDHHAIIPTTNVMNTDITALPSGELDLLNLVACRFLCSAAPAHIYEEVTVALDCEGYPFVVKGKNIIANGWKGIDEIYRSSIMAKPENEGDVDNTALSGLREGQTFASVTATVREGSTQPPKQYNDYTLLSSMDTAGADEMLRDNVKGTVRRGLGTPARSSGS